MTRRDAFRAASAAALFGIPADAATGPAPAMPPKSLLGSDPEAYWRRVREEQFLLPGWRAFLNNGSLGVAPRPVVNAVSAALARSAALETSVYPRWGYETM